MKRQSELGAAGLRVSIILIVLALGVIGVMQYRWFSDSAEAELDEALRSLNATVAQAVSREYQRYAPLLGELRSLRDGPAHEKPALEALLERAYSVYGPAGVTPGLLASVGISAVADTSSMSAFDPAGRTWRQAPSPLPARLAERDREALCQGDLCLWSGGAVRLILFRPAFSSPYLIVLMLDSDRFFSDYLAPAVAAALPGAELRWEEGPAMGREPGLPPPELGFDPRFRGLEPRLSRSPGPRFNPLRGFLGRKAAASFALPIPDKIDPFQSFQGGPPARPGGASFRVTPIGSPEGPGGGRARILRVTPAPASAIGSMERRLSLNLAFSILVLVGVGFAFVQAMFQRQKLGLLRQREREFVASVTHELRTPLTVISTAADNMSRGLVPQGRIAEYAALIAGQAGRLGKMIEEVLLYSEVEGRVRPPGPLVPTGPEKLEAELRGPLEELARGAGASLEWDLAGLPRVFLGDPEGIGLVVSNLVANAALHAYGRDAGGPVRVAGRVVGPGKMTIVVEDDGRGIARHESELVFEPFYRDETARARREKGTGLGLFLARRQAAAMGGELSLESPYRRADGSRRPGCRFTLELPCTEVTGAA